LRSIHVPAVRDTA